jgi:aminoglycoside phosphotransferase (APT) family kinase protein
MAADAAAEPAAPTPGAGIDAGADVPGIDVPRVTEWFVEHLDGVVAPLEFTLIAGGRSNPTFRVVDAAGHAFALRRPPVSHVLPTAHDMTREHRLISALGPAGVPVPRALGLCTDEEVNGQPFYVMEFVDGHILRDLPAAERELDEATRGRIGPNMASTLAGLHAVDVDAVGLGDLARHDGYVERQLKRWSGQYAQMSVEGVDHGGIVERVAADLAARIPEQRAVSVVHGDYRLDNMVLADDGSVRAVLDWEICTLGDPLADVGLLMVYWTEADDELPVLGVAPTLAPGFSSRAEVLDAYAAASGRDVSDVPYFMAFGYWKLACILQGVYARYVGGAGSGDSGSVDDFPRHVERLAQAAAATLAGRSPR